MNNIMLGLLEFIEEEKEKIDNFEMLRLQELSELIIDNEGDN